MPRSHRQVLTALIASAAVIAPMMAVSPAFAVTTVTPQVETSPTSLIDMPESYPFQPELQEYPDNPADASIARGAIPYDEIAPKLNDWMEESEIITTQVVGQSANGWDIYMVTVTAPETAEETAQQEEWRDEVKYDAANAADDEELLAEYKKPIWFNGNIHGNEWEGTDASLNYIQYLLENENTDEVQQKLQNYRMYFTVTNNPDGRIIGQRPNGQNLDLNRDFVTNTTNETALIRDLTAEIQPIFFIDLHGYTNVLQIEPCGPPHGENYDYDLFVPHAYAAALQIEKDVVDAAIPGNTYRDKVTGATSTTKTDTSGIIIPYRDTPSGWDDWPPVFTAQYVAYQGAISYTAELPLGRVSNTTTNQFNSAVDTKVGFQVIDSTMDYIDENNDDILENQIEIFRRGAAGEPLKKINTPVDASQFSGPTEWAALWGADDAQGHDELTGAVFPRSYVIPVGEGQKSETDAAYLVDFLITHGLVVKKTTAPYTVGDKTYPVGSYIVDMHQPLRGLANALLAAGSDISSWVPSMYDISAWSQGYLWGATVDRVGSTTDADLGVTADPIAAASDTGSIPVSSGSYLTFSLDGVDDFRGLNALLAAGVPVSLVGTNTAVIGNDEASFQAASSVAGTYGVAFAKTPGLELSGSTVKPLKKLQIGYTGNQEDTLSLRQMGFAADQLTLISSANLQSGATTLDSIDVLWIGAALTINSSTQPVAYAAMQNYVAAGKGAVGRGANANTFANTWYDAQSTSVAGNSSGNGIVNLDTVADGVFGKLDTQYGFVYPAVSFAINPAGHGKIEQTFATENTLISGHWRQTSTTNGPAYAAGRASVISATTATGAKALVFGTSPVFRTHTKGHFSEVSTALFWAAKPSTGAAVVAPAETSTSLTVSAESAAFGIDTTKAVVKVSATGDPNRTGTVSILDGTTEVAFGTVNRFGNVTVSLPGTLTVGEKSLTAVYTPTPGTALTTSASDAVAYEVTPAITSTELTLSAPSQVFGEEPQAVADVTVTVTEGAVPLSGTVSLLADGTEIASVPAADSTVSIPVPLTLAEGEHTLTGAFTPVADAPVLGSVSAGTAFTVEPAPAVEPEKSPSTVKVYTYGRSFGKASTATATVTSTGEAPTGRVLFSVDGKSYKSAEISGGKATVTLSPTLSAKSHSVTAKYLGDDNTLSGSVTGSVSVSKASTKTSLKLSSGKAVKGKTTLRASIAVTVPGTSATAAGKVTVTVNGKSVKTGNLSKYSGKVSVKLPKFTKSGTAKVVVTYAGNGNLDSSASVTRTVKVSSK